MPEISTLREIYQMEALFKGISKSIHVAHRGHVQPCTGCHHIPDGPEGSGCLSSTDILLATGTAAQNTF